MTTQPVELIGFDDDKALDELFSGFGVSADYKSFLPSHLTNVCLPCCQTLDWTHAMTVRLEHANLIVRDIDSTIRFLQTAFPEFRIRFDGTDKDGTRWVHIGTHDTYIALSKASVEPETRWAPYSGVPGVNHLAYEVDDVDALRERLRSSGYEESTVTNKHPHRKRVYFLDPDGNDWEFIQYLTDDPQKRHDYALPDK